MDQSSPLSHHDADTGVHPIQSATAPETLTRRARHCGSSSVLVFGDAVFPLRDGENVIGRGSGVTVILNSPVVSRRHARITIARDRALLEDLGSKNGTYIGEHRVAAPTEIADKAAIRVGSLWLLFLTPPFQHGHDSKTSL